MMIGTRRERRERRERRDQTHIQVQALSSHEWRICDSRMSHDDARSLLGFIEDNDGTFEVVEFSDPVKYSVAGSLTSAISRFTGGTPGSPRGNVTALRGRRPAA